MEIENYLQALMHDAKQGPQDTADPSDLNTQEGILETHGAALEAFDLDLQERPTELSLVVHLIPSMLQDAQQDYRFSFMSNGEGLRPIALAQLDNGFAPDCCAAIDVQWQGEGDQCGPRGVMEPLEDLFQERSQGSLFRKVFNVPPGAGLQCEENIRADQNWEYGCSFWEGPRMDEKPLIPFGGLFPRRLDPEDMSPMYASVQGGENRTEVAVHSQQDWEQYGVYPDRKGIKEGQGYSLVDIDQPYVMTSLAQDIRYGLIEFGPADMTYISYDYDVLDPAIGKLLLHFKQG